MLIAHLVGGFAAHPDRERREAERNKMSNKD